MWRVFGAEPLSEAPQADKAATIGVTDGLVHLFANRWAPLVAGRNRADGDGIIHSGT
jgi:hypothetical protein